MNPTHYVSLWLANDEPLYRQAQALAAIAEDQIELADSLKDWVTELVQVDEAGLRSDLISHALAHVDWRELAEEVGTYE